MHLFNVDVPKGPVLLESRNTAPGSEVHLLYRLSMAPAFRIPYVADATHKCISRGRGNWLQMVACDSPAGRLGVTICYDLRFPEMYQRLAFEQGAQIMLVPSAFTKVTGGRLRCSAVLGQSLQSACYKDTAS